MTPVAFAAFNVVLLCAAVSDLRRYRIPNALPALLALAGVVLAWPHSPAEALSRAGSLLLVALVGAPLWLRGALGGGDLKLLLACALWAPLGSLGTFLVALGLASGLQGVSALAWSRLFAGAPLASAVHNRIPYAISIAAAGLVWSWLRLSPG